MNVTGIDNLMRVLGTLEKKTAKAAMRSAVRAGTTILKSAVKASTPVDKGLLKKAQDFKVSTRADRVLGIVGANVAKLQAAKAVVKSRPSNIDWLVENGHVTPDGRFVPPSGYMTRAKNEAMPDALARMEQVLRESIEGLVES